MNLGGRVVEDLSDIDNSYCEYGKLISKLAVERTKTVIEKYKGHFACLEIRDKNPDYCDYLNIQPISDEVGFFADSFILIFCLDLKILYQECRSLLIQPIRQ